MYIKISQRTIETSNKETFFFSNCVYDTMAVQTLVHGCENWSLLKTPLKNK